jgi:hypothetical protein
MIYTTGEGRPPPLSNPKAERNSCCPTSPTVTSFDTKVVRPARELCRYLPTLFSSIYKHLTNRKATPSIQRYEKGDGWAEGLTEGMPEGLERRISCRLKTHLEDWSREKVKDRRLTGWSGKEIQLEPDWRLTWRSAWNGNLGADSPEGLERKLASEWRLTWRPGIENWL